MVSYTWSSLWGNYTGLTTTDQTDGGGVGRNSPDTTRAFDEPFYYFGANGQSNNGPLPTDRPNTFKGYAYYDLPWSQKTRYGHRLWHLPERLSGYSDQLVHRSWHHVRDAKYRKVSTSSVVVNLPI